MPKHNISPSTRFFPHKERYEIFDGIVEKFKIFVQDFVPIRTALIVLIMVVIIMVVIIVIIMVIIIVIIMVIMVIIVVIVV